MDIVLLEKIAGTLYDKIVICILLYLFFFLSCISFFFFLLVFKLLMNSKRWIWVLSDLHVRSVLTVLRPVYDSVGTTMDWMRTSPRQSRCVGIRS